MNKIINNNIDSIRKDYVAFVEPIVSNRLNFVIGIIGAQNKLVSHKELNKDSFSLNGILYNIGTDAYQKKELSNLFLDAKKQVTITNGEIKSVRLTKITNYKKELQSGFPKLDSYLYINKNLKLILGEKLEKLSKQFSHLKKEFEKIGKLEKSIIEAIFIYPDIFQKPKGTLYYGLKLAQALKVDICPYCNRDDIQSTFDVDGIKLTGPTIDHFLGQAEYPFLALTFYNLIPSCYDCNSQLKRAIPFDLKHFLYPYEDSYENIAAFKIFQRKSIIEKKLVDDNDLEIVIKDLIDDTKTDFLKLHGPLPKDSDLEKGNLNVFQSQSIYNQKNLKNAKILIDKHRTYPKAHVDSIFNSMLKDQGLSKEAAYLSYYEGHLNEEDFNKMPLSRFKRDLNIQLNKIYGFNHT